MAPNRASGAHIPHTTESTRNDHVKQYWCETSENGESDHNFDLLWVPKWPKNLPVEAHIVQISDSSSNEHINQDWCKSRGNSLTK